MCSSPRVRVAEGTNCVTTWNVCLCLHLQGQVKELDALARKFMAAATADKKHLLVEAKAAADAVDTIDKPDAKGYVEYYIKTMQRVLDKGQNYVEQVGFDCKLLGMLLQSELHQIKCHTAVAEQLAHRRL